MNSHAKGPEEASDVLTSFSHKLYSKSRAPPITKHGTVVKREWPRYVSQAVLAWEDTMTHGVAYAAGEKIGPPGFAYKRLSGRESCLGFALCQVRV